MKTEAITKDIETMVVPLVEEFRKLQNPNGSLDSDKAELGVVLLNSVLEVVRNPLTQLGQDEFYLGFEKDVKNWIGKGLHTEPYFDNTRDAYKMIGNGSESLFVGIVQNQNCPPPRGYYLECFFCKRDEPKACEALYGKYPHPKNACQSTMLICGSSGFTDGNCIVFFPENIKCESKVVQQKYAVFFFNKFRNIYMGQTIPNVEKLVVKIEGHKANERLASTELSEVDMYAARCVWGYLHDYHHHQGPRPFDEFIYLKMNWYVGLLEELRADCKTAIACYEDNFLFGDEVFEFILLDRVFRYPYQHDWKTNFDSGTGLFLFEWFKADGAFSETTKGVIIDIPKVVSSMKRLIAEIERIDALPVDQNVKLASNVLVRSVLDFEDSARVIRTKRFEIEHNDMLPSLEI